MIRRAQALTVGVLLAVCALPTVESSAAPGTSAANMAATVSGGSSLARLAQGLSALPLTEANVVVFGPIRTPQGIKLSEEARVSLHAQLVQVAGSSVPLSQKRLTEPLTLGAARLQARRRHLALLYVTPEVVGGELVLDVTFIQWPSSFWQRVVLPEGTTTLHENLRVPADELIRRLLPPPPGLFSNTKKFKNPVQTPVALACGDINGDGAEELLIVGRRDLVLGRFKKNSFVTEAKNSWADLSPIASAPLRAPLASAAIDPSGAVVGLSDRARMVKLDAKLRLLGDAAQAYPLSTSECLQFVPTGVSENSFPCTFPEQAQRPTPIGAFDALARGHVTETNGVVSQVTTLLPVGEAGVLRIESGTHSGENFVLKDLGDAFAFSDLDGDGSLEFLSSQAKIGQEKDTLLLQSLKSGRLKRVLEKKPNGAIHALTICPFSRSNPLAVVAAIGSELWLFQ